MDALKSPNHRAVTPSYVTFEQAKRLKEKGFNEVCTNAYNERGLAYENGWCEYIDDEELEITNAQLKPKDVAAPEQWQVVEWLRVLYGIWVEVQSPDQKDRGYTCNVQKLYSYGNHYRGEISEFDTPQAAYSAAFDYLLKELIAN